MPDFRITIDLSDTTGADVDALAEAIHRDYGDFHVFTLTTQQKIGDELFGRVPGDDEIGV